MSLKHNLAALGLLMVSACVGTTKAPTDGASGNVVDLRCVYLEEQLSKLIAAHGKGAIVLDGAFERNACSSQIYWPVNQSRTALTNSHLIVFGPKDNIPQFLELSQHNAAVIKAALPAEVSNQKGRITSNLGGATFNALDHIFEDCKLAVTLPSVVSGSLWAVSMTPVPFADFCVGAGDYFSALGLVLETDGKRIVARRRDTQ